MTNPPESPTSPASPVPVAPRTSPAAVRGIRYGMSLVAVLLGAYVLIDGSWTSFPSVLLSRDPLLGFFLVSQLLFGTLVIVFGAVVAPVDGARRAIAAVIVVVLVALWAILQPALSLGALRVPIRMTFNPGTFFSAPFLVTLAATTAWLIIRRRPGVSYLLLIATILIPIVLNAILFASLPSAVSLITANVLSAVLGVGIAWAARGIAGRRSEPIG